MTAEETLALSYRSAEKKRKEAERKYRKLGDKLLRKVRRRIRQVASRGDFQAWIPVTVRLGLFTRVDWLPREEVQAALMPLEEEGFRVHVPKTFIANRDFVTCIRISWKQERSK